MREATSATTAAKAMNARLLIQFVFQASVFFYQFSTANAADAAGTDSPEIASYLKSVGKVHSYDIVINQKKTPLIKSIVGPEVIRNGRKMPSISYVEFPPGETGSATFRKTRQVWESSGRRRVEIDLVGKHSNNVRVFDGEVVRAIDSLYQAASVTGKSPSQFPLLVKENRYDTLYSEMSGGGTYGKLFASREIIHIESNGRYAIIHSPAQPGNMYPKYDFRLTLDSDHGNLPIRIEERIGDALRSITQISRFHQLDDGAWVPIEATHEFHIKRDGRDDVPVPGMRVDLTVDLAESAWNVPIDEKEFTLPFPPGTRVRDEVQGAMMVVEGVDTGASLEELAVQSRKIIGIGPDGVGVPIRADVIHAPDRQFRSWIIVANVVFLIGIFSVLIWRKRRPPVSLNSE